MPHLGVDSWGTYDEHGNVAPKPKTEDEQRAANERAQVEQVFGLTGGELMDVAWVPLDAHPHAVGTVERYTDNPFTFTYWYQGVPDYLEGPEWHPTDATYRTVCANEMFGQVPETVTDDEGTWKVVARYRTSGECECPARSAEAGSANAVPATGEHCPLCEADLMAGEEHGYIYIGDGRAEIVYRLEPPTLQHVEFDWSTKHGQCYDCGLPAGFQLVGDAGSTGKRCAVCAANAAADGEQITRLFPES